MDIRLPPPCLNYLEESRHHDLRREIAGWMGEHGNDSVKVETTTGKAFQIHGDIYTVKNTMIPLKKAFFCYLIFNNTTYTQHLISKLAKAKIEATHN